MAQTSQIVISGFVGTAPKQWNSSGKSTACSFRVGCSRRYFSVKDNEWKSAETTWIGVRAFRSLADNILTSITVGDPVIVTGSLSMDSWEKDGIQHTMPVIEATNVGHDLCYGTATFAKTEQPQDFGTNSGANPSESQTSAKESLQSDTRSKIDEVIMV